MVSFELGDAFAPLRVDVSTASDRGLVRSLNEDSLLAEAPVFAVADGMGGHSMGDRASAAAITELRARLAGRTLQPNDVLQAIAAANAAVHELGAAADGRVAGTTLAGVALVAAGVPASPHWMVFNIGDSRVYRWNGRELRQVSVDHSAVQELIDRGEIEPDAARRHPDRNIVTRALGPIEPANADAWLLPAEGTLSFLICSDGLSRELSDDQLARALAGDDPESMTTAQHLVSLALAAGGRDNVTAIVVSAVAEPSSIGDSTLDGHRSLEETLPRN